MLFVPPFAEEMNKCRRQVAETSQRLIDAGHAVLVPDLFGTGDSGGDFAEATWERWRGDIVSTIAWAAAQGLPVEAVVATRLGCALAAEALRQADYAVRRTVFWQPVGSGRQFMTQFLRLRVAASMMASGETETVEDLRARLDRDEALEVAGYPLTRELCYAIERVELASVLDAHLGRLAIFEAGRSGNDALSVPGRRLLESAADSGIEASGFRIVAEPFWSSTEIVVSPELAVQTVEFLTEVVS